MKKITKNIPKIEIIAQPSYMSDQSDPEHHRFIWSYQITVHNQSADVVQLLNRRWRIVDMNGKVEEVHGVGVIGLQPMILPEKSFSYTSFCHLTTPQGIMSGEYEFQNIEEQRFLIAIPKFILTAPTSITRLFRSRLH